MRIVIPAILLIGPATLLAAEAPDKVLTGQVLAADGKPAGGAFVSIVHQGKTGKFETDSAVQCGADGTFQLKAPAGDSYSPPRVVADIPGIGFAGAAVSDAGAGMVLKLAPAMQLHLTVIGPDGNPAAGILMRPIQLLWSGNVVFLPDAIAGRWAKRTGDDGTVDFAGIPRRSKARLEADDDRFAQLDVRDDIQIPDDAAVSRAIHLAAAGSISGTVTYSDSGKPAAEIAIFAQSAHSGGGPLGGGGVRTDAEGHFQVKRLLAAKYVVELSSLDEPADWTAAAAVLDVNAGADNHANLLLIHGGILTGRVRDAAGKPVVGIMVGLHGPGHPEIASAIQGVKTDANGAYTMRVAPGTQEVYLASAPPGGSLVPGMGSNPMHGVDVAERQTVTLDFDLRADPSPLVEGHVIDPDGNPVAGATVIYSGQPVGGGPAILGERTATTDAAGRFQVHAGVGTSLRAKFKDMATESPTRIMATGGFFTLQLAPHATFDLTAKVVDENGAPIPGVTAGVVPREGGLMISQAGNADGEVEFEGLGTDERWMIQAKAQGYGVSQSAVPPARSMPRHVIMTITLKKTGETKLKADQ